MADKMTRADRINLGLTVANLAATVVLGIIGVYIAVKVETSANHLSPDGLFVASGTLLVDDAPQHRETGRDIVLWLERGGAKLPDWEDKLLRRVTDAAQVSGPDVPQAASAPQTPSVQAANQLVQDLGGAFPRLFIQYQAPEQLEQAEKLRAALGGINLDGQVLLIPQIQHVGTAPNTLDLRYFHDSDANEAQQLASILKANLNQNVRLNDRSPDYVNRGDVKRRTYELWFPAANGGAAAPRH